MDVPQPEQTIDWSHDGFRVIRVFVQDPMAMATRERLMATVMRFREIPNLAALKSEVAAIASATGLKSTVFHQADHVDPFGEWVTIGFSGGAAATSTGSGRSGMANDPWQMG
jgi:hypothetical protein